MDGLEGPVDRLVEPVYGFFLFFVLIYRGGQTNCLGKSTIDRDLWSETITKTASKKPFCSPPIKKIL
jgi:hypothetical protein